MKSKYKDLVVDASIKDFLWKRNLELNNAIEKLIRKGLEKKSEKYLTDAVDKTLEMIIKSHGKSLRKK